MVNCVIAVVLFCFGCVRCCCVVGLVCVLVFSVFVDVDDVLFVCMWLAWAVVLCCFGVLCVSLLWCCWFVLFLLVFFLNERAFVFCCCLELFVCACVFSVYVLMCVCCFFVCLFVACSCIWCSLFSVFVALLFVLSFFG